MLGLACILSTRLVYAVAYEYVGKTIEGPNQFLVPLLLTTAYLVGCWLLIWGTGMTHAASFWIKGAGALFAAALIGISAGYIAMAVQREPKIGMFTIFIVGGLAWCLLTTLWWRFPRITQSVQISSRVG